MSISFYADTVGSYIRPESIQEASKKFLKGEITTAENQAIQDKEIKELVEKQVALGLKIVTDGELRREAYWFDFWGGVNGVKAINRALGPPNAPEPRVYVKAPEAYDKVSFNPNNPEFSHFEFLKSVTPTGVIPKVLIPSPNFLRVFRTPGDEYPSPAYSSKDAFYYDVSSTLNANILEYYKRGARVIQIDDPTFFIFAFIGASTTEARRALLLDLIASSVAMLKPALADLPADLQIAIHVCRANGDTHWPVPYGYGDVLHYFTALQPNYLLLEYDDERSGTFEVLKQYAAALPKTRFFLGVVTTKSVVVEKLEYVEAKLREAGKEVGDINRIGVCPQCGFGTFKPEYGQQTSLTSQWKKVELLGQVQKKIWNV